MKYLKPQEAGLLRSGYSLYDPYTFIRFDNSISKVTRENIMDIVSMINSSREPETVKRTALYLIKKYVNSTKKRGRVMIKDRELFFNSVIYYARVFNNLPVVTPSRVHKGLKRFMLEVMNENPDLRERFYKNRFEPQNFLYSTLMKTTVKKYDDLEFHVYRVSSIFGKLFRKFGYFTTKPQLSFAVFAYHIAKLYGYPSSVKLLSKIFMTSDAYIMILHKKHRDKLDDMLNSLSSDEKSLLLESLKNILEKMHKSHSRSKE